MNLTTDSIQELERTVRNSPRACERFAAQQAIKRLAAVKRAGGVHYVSGNQQDDNVSFMGYGSLKITMDNRFEGTATTT